MNKEQQKHQRDKLIELVNTWRYLEIEIAHSCHVYKGRVPFAELQKRRADAERAFREYVEHMHDDIYSNCEYHCDAENDYCNHAGINENTSPPAPICNALNPAYHVNCQLDAGHKETHYHWDASDDHGVAYEWR